MRRNHGFHFSCVSLSSLSGSSLGWGGTGAPWTLGLVVVPEDQPGQQPSRESVVEWMSAGIKSFLVLLSRVAFGRLS